MHVLACADMVHSTQTRDSSSSSMCAACSTHTRGGGADGYPPAHVRAVLCCAGVLWLLAANPTGLRA